MDPASKNPYSSFFYDIKGAEPFNKSKVPDASGVGVVAKGDWTLEVTLEGPRGYFPVLSAYLAALPAHRPSVEKHGDKWTEAANIVCNGPFTLEAWEHNKVMVLRKNKHFFDAKDVTLDKVTIPIIPVQSGALPYENNELDITALQTGDLKRLRDDPRTGRAGLPLSVPGHLVPHAPGDEAALRQREGAPRRGPRHRPRERGAGGRRLRHPGPLHDPARLPGRGRRQEDPRHPALRSEGRDGACSRARPTRAGATGRRSR